MPNLLSIYLLFGAKNGFVYDFINVKFLLQWIFLRKNKELRKNKKLEIFEKLRYYKKCKRNST